MSHHSTFHKTHTLVSVRVCVGSVSASVFQSRIFRLTEESECTIHNSYVPVQVRVTHPPLDGSDLLFITCLSVIIWSNYGAHSVGRESSRHFFVTGFSPAIGWLAMPQLQSFRQFLEFETLFLCELALLTAVMFLLSSILHYPSLLQVRHMHFYGRAPGTEVHEIHVACPLHSRTSRIGHQPYSPLSLALL